MKPLYSTFPRSFRPEDDLPNEACVMEVYQSAQGDFEVVQIGIENGKRWIEIPCGYYGTLDEAIAEAIRWSRGGVPDEFDPIADEVERTGILPG